MTLLVVRPVSWQNHKLGQVFIQQILQSVEGLRQAV